jgi:flavin reductase (DIM6/NTAB) family NADH-FMN oxidoreductase RutF
VSDAQGAFHSLVSGIEYPMVIVTASAAGERSGCLVGFSTQASMDPPRFLVLLSKLNHTLEVAERADLLVVHFLHQDNRDLAELFGEETGDKTDKFTKCRWREGPGATPVLAGVTGWLAGPILARFDMGDHIAHLLDVTDAAVERPGRQLGSQDVRGLRPGHPA